MARRCVIAAAVALLLCVPWLTYTYSLTSKPFYWGNSGALSLYWMSAPGSGQLGDWHEAKTSYGKPELAPDAQVFTGLRGLERVQRDTKLQHIAIQNIKNDPKRYLTNVVNNVDRLLFNSPYSFTNQKASSMLYAVPNAFLLCLLCIALLVALRARRSLRPEFLPIAVLVAIGFAVHIPVAAYARFVIPLVPVVVWLVVVVLSRHVRVVAGAPPEPMSSPGSNPLPDAPQAPASGA
jgi:hypothetical protein